VLFLEDCVCDCERVKVCVCVCVCVCDLYKIKLLKRTRRYCCLCECDGMMVCVMVYVCVYMCSMLLLIIFSIIYTFAFLIDN